MHLLKIDRNVPNCETIYHERNGVNACLKVNGYSMAYIVLIKVLIYGL